MGARHLTSGSFMAINKAERQKMLRAHSIGSAMVRYLEAIGVERLSDLKGADAQTIALRMNAVFGRQHIDAQGVRALKNLIALADE